MLVLEAASKYYGQKPIFKELNLTFEAGKSYALVGQSGSGKSTLLNCLARLEPLSAGQIKLDDKPLKAIKEKQFFRDVLGYVFQNYALVEDETVGQNLSLVDKNKQRQIAALAHVGLSDQFLSQRIFELSGGQGQRVAIARLLLKKARLILADEPTGALDQATGQAIRDLLLTLKGPDTVVVFATHDPNIYQHVDEVINMADLQKKLDKTK